MLNPLLLFSAQIVAIISVLLLAVGYLKAEPKAASARVFAVMAVFIIFYILDGMSGTNIDPAFQVDLSRWSLVISIGTSSITGLFMIYCFLTFQEQQKFPVILLAAFALQVFVDAVIAIMNISGAAFENPSIFNLLAISMDVLMLVFVGFAIYWTIKGWRADLVEDRRVYRWFIIGVQGTLIFAVVFVENFLLDTNSSGSAVGQAIIYYAIALLVFGMVLGAMRFDYVSLSSVIRKVVELRVEPQAGKAQNFNLESFNLAFKEKQLYREAGLTIAMLAKKLNMPEYRLRAFIHKQLGYRNFNAMLHQYRIEDASIALSDGEKKGVPVLTIALSVGYQSITPFNNAFRQIMGVTPSEYRKQNC